MFAGQMVQELDAELGGVEIVPVSQTFMGLSPACKELERLVGAAGVPSRRQPGPAVDGVGRRGQERRPTTSGR
jgi:hypothetical protein